MMKKSRVRRIKSFPNTNTQIKNPPASCRLAVWKHFGFKVVTVNQSESLIEIKPSAKFVSTKLLTQIVCFLLPYDLLFLKNKCIESWHRYHKSYRELGVHVYRKRKKTDWGGGGHRFEPRSRVRRYIATSYVAKYKRGSYILYVVCDDEGK